MLFGRVQKVCKQKNYICSLIYAGHGELEEKIREADEKADIRGIVFLGTEYFHSPDKGSAGGKDPACGPGWLFPGLSSEYGQYR